MPTDLDPQDDNLDDGGESDLDARIESIINARLNSALSTHVKRAMGGFERRMTEMFEQFATTQQQGAALDTGADPGPLPGEYEAGDGGGAASAMLQSRLAQLEAELAQERSAREQTALMATRNSVHGQLKELLAAKGVTGARARAVIADFEASNILQYDDETGEPFLAVKRARGKGARAEELVFDLEAGIDDWVQSPDAEEFLPAPGARREPAAAGSRQILTRQTVAARERGQAAGGGERKPRGSGSERTIVDPVQKTLAQLEDAGVDANRLAQLIDSD